MGGVLVVPDVFGPFDLLSDRAHQLYVDGDPAAAVVACDEALTVVRAAGDRATELFLCYSRGLALRELGLYADLVAQSQELLVLSAGDGLWRAKALALLAEASAVMGRGSTALDLVAEGLDIVESAPEGYNRMSARMALAITLEALGLYDPAERVLTDLVVGHEAVRATILEECCVLRATWGAVAALLGEEAEARHHLLVVAERALGMRRAAARAGDSTSVVRADVFLAAAYARLGDHDAAWALLGDPSVLDRLSPAGPERLVALLVRGEVLLGRGELRAAAESLEVVERVARRSRRDVWQWAAVDALAAVDVAEHGDHPAVRRVRAHARELLRELRRDRRSRTAELAARRRVRQLLDERDGVHRAALTDPLTGLGNRRALLELLEGAPEALGAVFVDVDRFKDVNDSFGHETGDRVLVRVAEMLTAACRSSELVVRYGGDEFVVLVPEDPAAAESIAYRVLEAVRATEWHQVAPGLEVTVSVGVETSAPVASALASADAALYTAKRSGRDRVVVGVAPTVADGVGPGEDEGPHGVRLPLPTALTDGGAREEPLAEPVGA